MWVPLLERKPVTTVPAGHETPAGRPPGRGRMTGCVNSMRESLRRSAMSRNGLHSPTASSMEAPVRPRIPRNAKPFGQYASNTGPLPGLLVRPVVLNSSPSLPSRRMGAQSSHACWKYSPLWT